MLIAEKLEDWGQLNAIISGSLVHIINQLSRKCYLIDTGASFSISTHTSSAPPQGQRLTVLDGQQIPRWGEMKIILVFCDRRFVWTFLVNVQFLIIEVHFLHFQLLVDPSAKCLVDSLFLESFPIVMDQSRTPSPADAGLCAATAPVFKQVCCRRPSMGWSIISG
jgi:hypothetical protein